MTRPELSDVLDRLHVVALPMRVRFRGITTREVALIDGPAGWGEFGAFPEYGPPEAAHWLAAGLEAAYRPLPPARHARIPINATVPAVQAAAVADVLARFPGARTAKVKVAEPGQSLADDVARVTAVRALVPTVRVDANGGWSVDEAVTAARALTADGPLEYLEQPCATVPELAEVRRRVQVPVAADESIRKADDPLHVAGSGGSGLVWRDRGEKDQVDVHGTQPCCFQAALGRLGCDIAGRFPRFGNVTRLDASPLYDPVGIVPVLGQFLVMDHSFRSCPAGCQYLDTCQLVYLAADRTGGKGCGRCRVRGCCFGR